MTKKITLAIVATLALAGCGDARDQTAELGAEADAAVEERGVAQAVVSAVDLTAAKDIAERAALAAVREALPAEEIAAAATIIDEEKLLDGLNKAIDGHAIGEAVQGALDEAGSRHAPAPAE